MLEFKYPMKPMPVPVEHFKNIDPSKYTMEMKFDGFRAILVVDHTPTLWTRVKTKIETPTNLQEQLSELNIPHDTILDGEIWNPLKRGGWKHSNSIACELTIWDILRYSGRDLSNCPIEERRQILLETVHSTGNIRTVEILPATREEHDRIHKEALTSRGRSGFIHGVVLKRNGSPRRDHATRSQEHPDWLKIVYPNMQSGSKS